MAKLFNTNDWIIRFAEGSDAEGIQRIYKPIVDDTAITFELECPDQTDIESRIAKSFEKHLWLVCTFANQIAGYAYASSFRSRAAYRWITEVSVYVNPDFKRRGVARGLYDALHACLKKQGYTRSMAVMTAPNPMSQKFHLAYGFKHDVLLNKMGYKFEQWHDIEIMSLELNISQNPMPEIIPISNIFKEELEHIFSTSVQTLR